QFPQGRPTPSPYQTTTPSTSHPNSSSALGGPETEEPLDGDGGVEPDVARGLVVAVAAVELPARFLGRVAVPGAAHAAAREHGELTNVVRVVLHRRLGVGVSLVQERPDKASP